MRWKNQSQSNSGPTNKEHQPKDALSMFLSRQCFAETGVCSCEQKNVLVLILACPLIFCSLGVNCIFSHFKRSAIFICPVYVAIQFKTYIQGFESNSSGKCK